MSHAQGTSIQFGDGAQTSGLPVEVTADLLEFDQEAGTALFTGNVLIIQGPMRLSGEVVDVNYGPAEDGTNRIERVEASGNVVMVNGPDAAEGERAVYSVESGVVVLSGDVLLTRPDAAISGEQLTVNVDTGQGVMEGRVSVVFTPEQEAQ